jgi:hypothetical protein
MGTVAPMAVTILAYIVILHLPVKVPPTPLQVLVSASCSTLAIVTMFRSLRTGPVWARIVTGIVILPLLIHVVLIFWSAARGSRLTIA